MNENFDLEGLVKPFVSDVREALKGYEGRVGSLEQTIDSLKDEQRRAARAALFAGAVPGQKAALTADEKTALVEFAKGMSGTTGPTGGFAVPEVIASDIEALTLKLSPVRQVANVRRIDTPNYRLLVNVRGTTTGWVGETDTRAGTATPQLESITPPLGTVYALAEVTEELLADFAQNLDMFLTEDVAEHLAEQESIAFISGDGANKPKGFLAGPAPVATGDATRAFGTLQYIATGNASTLGSDLPGKLLAMAFATKAGYRQGGAAFMASTATIEALGNLKDTQNRPLFYPSLREGTPGTLLGYPLVEAEHMPNVGTGTFPIAFGNWQRGYTIVDRTGLDILRDPYTKKGSVLFYIRKRVGGTVRNSEAIKLLKCATS